MLGLEQIRIVLVDARYGGNLGAAARALGNMGLRDLALVRPAAIRTQEASLLAAKAQQVLREAQVYARLDAALGDADLVIGTSARNRRFPIPTYLVREAATRILIGDARRVAILFGSEDKGLTNEELSYCGMRIVIPSSSDYPVLNLAAAVQIVCYELHIAACPSKSVHGFHRRKGSLANSADMENFYAHLAEWVREVRFFNPQNPLTIMRRLRNIFNRAHLRSNEVKMLRGLITNSVRVFKDNKEKESVHSS